MWLRMGQNAAKFEELRKEYNHKMLNKVCNFNGKNYYCTVLESQQIGQSKSFMNFDLHVTLFHSFISKDEIYVQILGIS